MKRIIPLILALALLAACGIEPAAETPEITPTAAPSPSASPEPGSAAGMDFIAGPEAEGYTFRSEELGFSLEIPAEAAPYIGICRGIPGFVPEDEAYSFYYIYGDEGQYCGFISAIIAAGRRDFFNPGRYYNSDEHSAHYPIAASEEYVYMYQGGIGGYDLPLQKREGQEAAERAVSPVGLFDNLSVDTPSALPEISAETLRGASETIGALGDGILTRGETASLVFEMIDAENKDAPYPLRFTDVDPESEAARAAAYLDSYGMFARYDEDNVLIDDGNLFRPDEPMTLAEFVHLLQCALFARHLDPRYPLAFGDPVQADDLGERTWWERAELDRAWKDGWIWLEDGRLRPDEAITCAGIAKALYAAAGVQIPEEPWSYLVCETEWFTLRDAYAAALEPYTSWNSYIAGRGSVLLIEPKTRFSGLSVYTAEITDAGYDFGELLYTCAQDREPLVIELPFYGDLTAYGISLTDEAGAEHRLLLQTGGLGPEEACPYVITEL